MTAEESSAEAGQARGLLASLRKLAAMVVGILQTRLELLATELDEERLRLVQIACWAVIAIFFIALGVLMMTLFIVVLFWDSHRVLIIALLAAVYLAAGIALALRVRDKARAKSKLFSTSLAELAKDRDQLTSRNVH